MTTTTRALILLAIGAAGAGLVAIATLPAAASSNGQGAQHASAVLRGPGGTALGTAHFTEDGTGRVHVNVKVDGLAAGLHGIHIHAVGTCDRDFTSAGAHHNPLGALHGAHSGDLPNLVVNVAGQGRLNATTTRASLSPRTGGVFDDDGSALIIHASADDYVTQPTGNSGARVACGVITAG